MCIRDRYESNWYDYDSKYNSNNKIIIPAEIDSKITKEIKKIAIQSCRALNIFGFARVDFFLEKSSNKMLHGLLWLPLLFIFILLTALGWLERRRQNLFRNWASGSELCKLDSSGAASLKDGELKWSAFEAGTFEEKDSFTIKKLELVELMALTSGEAPLTNESQGKCRLRLVGDGKEMDVPFSDADQAREWMEQLMEKARCDL